MRNASIARHVDEIVTGFLVIALERRTRAASLPSQITRTGVASCEYALQSVPTIQDAAAFAAPAHRSASFLDGLTGRERERLRIADHIRELSIERCACGPAGFPFDELLQLHTLEITARDDAVDRLSPLRLQEPTGSPVQP